MLVYSVLCAVSCAAFEFYLHCLGVGNAVEVLMLCCVLQSLGCVTEAHLTSLVEG